MKKVKRLSGLLLAACLLLSGCGRMFDGSYASVKPHEVTPDDSDTEVVTAADFSQLYAALERLVKQGSESGVISVASYDQIKVEPDTHRAISQLCLNNPIAAYAVKEITFEVGKSAGQPALAVDVSYAHNAEDIKAIRKTPNVEQGMKLITEALNQYQPEIVLLVESYEETDFAQAVERYAQEHPQHVMELPRTGVSIYPKSGDSRVVELRFSYRTDREALRTMHSQVQTVFDSAALYVSGDAEELQKYEQLSAFLMERFDYQFHTSITPAYSLLCHGVGDSSAFARVYAAMCRQSGMECLVVTGTRDGQSHSWNIIRAGGSYYHTDLLAGGFHRLGDREMVGYVWDYSAYPPCTSEQSEEI